MTIHLSPPQPPDGFDLDEPDIRVAADVDLDGVWLTIADRPAVLMNVGTTVDLAMRLTGAVAEVQGIMTLDRADGETCPDCRSVIFAGQCLCAESDAKIDDTKERGEP